MAGPTRSRGGVVVLALVLLAVLAGTVALRSPLFEVRRVEVRGAGRLAPSEVRVLVEGARGRNLWLVPLDEIARSVSAHPWIARAEVGRRLPSTLVVEIEERIPIAWVADPDGGAAVAADGVVVQRRTDGDGLVAIGEVHHVEEPGGQTSAPRQSLRVVASLPPRIRREVEAASLRGEGVILRLRSGARILYGRADSLGAKRATLAALLDWIEENEVPAGLVDLRAPATPAIRASASGG